MDLSELYQDIILSHNKRPKNEGELNPRTHEAEGFNPLCGDRITVHINKNGDAIEEVQFIGEGCAISRASASIMTGAVKGLTEEAFLAKMEEVVGLLTSKEDPEVALDEWGDLAALVGVRRFPARIKCATLGWHTLQNALKGEQKFEA
ncbi:MAG: Fe-S cluster assembly sulfur transfer protein SufU [Verrucomicrobiota bacterium]